VSQATFGMRGVGPMVHGTQAGASMGYGVAPETSVPMFVGGWLTGMDACSGM
jgi:hypothetical protein